MPRWLLALMMLSSACTPPGAILAEDVPSDLAEVVSTGLQTVEEALPAHRGCLDGVIVSHAWELDDRAEYHPDSATIVLRVPATAPNLEFSLVHEIAHHLEFSCPSQRDLRPLFLTAQGHTADSDWFAGDSWEATPSEQFATAFAEYVTGRPEPQRHIALTGEARRLVARWARGSLTHGP
jgi:hypothetical protein